MQRALVVLEGEVDPSAKFILSNHQSVIEVVMLYVISGGCSFVTRIENLQIPFFSAISWISFILTHLFLHFDYQSPFP